ncbi:unnamed protein product [Peniophora sp. CBMAI 1063]|nr:unnamed protein product [Peniophora sp. CBMAI 1063]
MFPITCNAIGDIIAVVQLIRDIVVALDDARGAAEEYKQFVHVLTALGAVMEAVYKLARDSPDDALKSVVLEEVRRCCNDINNAHNSIAKFDRLEGETSVRTSRAGTLFTKLHWHFLKASDATKYAKRFSESHQRLNTYIGLLSHQSTSLLLEDQRYHLSVVHSQSLAARRSADRIEAVALSALQQVSSISRRQVTEETLSRPYFAVPHDRRVASRVQRVTDMIFDSLAPDTPQDQRDRFLSLLAPFLVAGAAFVVHNNVNLEWQATGLWSAICALVVQVLWLQSHTPMHPGYGLENGILLIGLLGEEITVPSHFCSSYKYFQGFLNLFYSEIPDASEYVSSKCYELFKAGTSWLISADNWEAWLREPGNRAEMGLLCIEDPEDDADDDDDDEDGYCPYCGCVCSTRSTSCELFCAGCFPRFRQTLVELDFVRLAGAITAADITERHRGTDVDLALSQMDVPVTAMTTIAQYFDNDYDVAAMAFARKCHRVHVIESRFIDYNPEHILLASQQVVDTLISDQDKFSRSTLVYELLRARIQSTSEWNDDGPEYGEFLRVEMLVYNAALTDLAHSIALIGNTHGSTVFDHPMTIMQQLLTQMTSALNAFLERPSEEGMRQWRDIMKGYSGEYLSFEERKVFRELVEYHAFISENFRAVFGFSGRSP